MILFSKFSDVIFSDVIPAFTCAQAIGNLCSISLGVNIMSPLPYFASYFALDTILA